uniref:Carboxylesterase type B domain-containing protein n=1 Tax=Timema shepardi TaxID=629360 RepID=A0A7R9FY91_TIMSH|nr:unnamed protein product [Timema shepardi]
MLTRLIVSRFQSNQHVHVSRLCPWEIVSSGHKQKKGALGSSSRKLIFVKKIKTITPRYSRISSQDNPQGRLYTVSGKQVIVGTSQGELLGATSTTADGTHYFTFRGVPYAKPPVGPLRFKSPREPEPWEGQRDARKFATRCLQEDGGSEDCLYLNVFTPQVTVTTTQLGPNSNLPVMVWFHWGAFAFGSADLNPGHLMDIGVVVVSVQYRLNVFGE